MHYDHKTANDLLSKCNEYIKSESPFHLTIALANEIDNVSNELKKKLESKKEACIDEIRKRYEYALQISKENNEKIDEKLDPLDKMIEQIKNELKIENVIAKHSTFTQKIDKIIEIIKNKPKDKNTPKRVKISSIIYPKIISSKEEIDSFVNELKEKLYKELQNNEKIEISGD